MSIDTEVFKSFLEVLEDNALDNGHPEFIKGYLAALENVRNIAIAECESYELSFSNEMEEQIMNKLNDRSY